MRRVLSHLRGNAVAYMALFFALAGVSYAAQDALIDKPDAVESRHISRHAVRAEHIDRGAVGQRALGNQLRERFRLAVEPPQAGTYTGVGTSPDNLGSVPITFTLTWSDESSTGGPGVTRIAARTDDPSHPCNYRNPGSPGDFGEGIGSWRWRDYQGGDSFDGGGAYIDSSRISIVSMEIQTALGRCQGVVNAVLKQSG